MVGGLTAPGTARPSNPSDTTTENQDDLQSSPSSQPSPDRRTLLLNVLRHVQDAFQSEDLLDNIPLEDVGDPSAWHAWRAYRGLAQRQKEFKVEVTANSQAAPPSPRNPGEWKWDGVWESRVKNSVAASISEAALFGNASGGSRFGSIPVELEPRQRSLASADRQFRFSKLSDERFEELKEQILFAGTASPQT